nr:methylated-DNA--[protein]-cysteine S-methyltransferase [Chitinivorax sp. B]
MKNYSTFDSPLGPMLAVVDDAALCGLYFVGQRYFPDVDETWQHQPDFPLLQQVKAQLDEYFEGNRTVFDVPFKPHGTLFQQRVWQALLAIPAGQTRSYAQLAIQLNLPNGARAVGAAVGRNPISVMIPCHRVVGSNGSLTGYAGGLPRKQHLLGLERSVTT